MCDFGIPWTFVLTFLKIILPQKLVKKICMQTLPFELSSKMSLASGGGGGGAGDAKPLRPPYFKYVFMLLIAFLHQQKKAHTYGKILFIDLALIRKMSLDPPFL